MNINFVLFTHFGVTSGITREWTFVLFTHFGVTSGITRNPWVIPVVTPKWVNNTNVHSKFTLISLFSKIHSLKSEHIHSFLFREYAQWLQSLCHGSRDLFKSIFFSWKKKKVDVFSVSILYNKRVHHALCIKLRYKGHPHWEWKIKLVQLLGNFHRNFAIFLISRFSLPMRMALCILFMQILFMKETNHNYLP